MSRKSRMIVAIEGPEGAGKTHWALTAPGPIDFYNFDRGLEGVEDKFPDKQINAHTINLSLPPELPVDGPAAVDWWKRAADQALAGISMSLGAARTVVVDKADQLWSAVNLGYPGEVYERKVELYQRMIRNAYDGDANLILLHGLKVIFSKNREGQSYPSGDMTCAGWDGTRSSVQLSFATRYSGNGYEFNTSNGRWVLSNGGAQQGQFEQTIIKSRDNVGLVGMTLPGTDFPTLCGMAFPGLDWSK